MSFDLRRHLVRDAFLGGGARRQLYITSATFHQRVDEWVDYSLRVMCALETAAVGEALAEGQAVAQAKSAPPLIWGHQHKLDPPITKVTIFGDSITEYNDDAWWGNGQGPGIEAPLESHFTLHDDGSFTNNITGVTSPPADPDDPTLYKIPMETS